MLVEESGMSPEYDLVHGKCWQQYVRACYSHGIQDLTIIGLIALVVVIEVCGCASAINVSVIIIYDHEIDCCKSDIQNCSKGSVEGPFRENGSLLLGSKDKETV